MEFLSNVSSNGNTSVNFKGNLKQRYGLGCNVSVDGACYPELPLDMRFNDGHFMAIAMYMGSMIVSAIGNVFVFRSLMGVRRRKGRLGRINMLLLNLALADLVVTFIMMPMEIVWNATVSWRAGDLLCRFLSFFRVFGLYLSGFVITCICLDRYFVVMTPFGIRNAEGRVKKLLAVAWIASILCSLPQSFIFHVERHPVFRWYEQCITFNSFPSPEYELAYSMLGLILMYAVPMTTIVYCYCCILCKMYSMSREKRNENHLRRSSTIFIQRAKNKTLKMTVVTALAFCICWTPYNVISLWYWFDRNSAMKLDQRVQKALFVFACTNSCFNPIIYGWYHVVDRPIRNNGIIIQHQIQRANVMRRNRNNGNCRPAQERHTFPEQGNDQRRHTCPKVQKAKEVVIWSNHESASKLDLKPTLTVRRISRGRLNSLPFPSRKRSLLPGSRRRAKKGVHFPGMEIIKNPCHEDGANYGNQLDTEKIIGDGKQDKKFLKARYDISSVSW